MTTWLKCADAAVYATVSEDLLRAAVKNGDLPAYAVGKGKEFRLTAEDIDEWMRSRSYEPARRSA